MELLDQRPRLVLIEGPCDATELIPLLMQPDTRPPIAILAYRPATDGDDPRTLAIPFCDYSPELVALRVARQLGAVSRFFDAPAAAFFVDPVPGETDRKPEERLPDAASPSLYRSLAERFGCSTHDEFWDSNFEMQPPEVAWELISSYGEMVRSRHDEEGVDRDLNQLRESWMLGEIDRALEEGYRREEVAVVCGAAHMAGLLEGETQPELLARARRLPPARFAVIPYSYPRLSEQSGYGAGNRAPAFYQETWRRRGDWDGASLEFLLRLMERMRGAGHSLSLADAIEAHRLATNLAGIRGKRAAGLEELRDASTACYGRGTEITAPYLAELLIGQEVGTVSSQAARTSLQQEFYDQVKRYGIPFADRPQDMRLNLTGAKDHWVSAFLHRLQTAEIPFARLVQAGSSAPRAGGEGGHDPLEQLMAMKEKWEVCWTPSTEIRLIEMTVQGNTLAEVCGRLLRRRLEAARGLEEASEVLLEVVMGRLEGLYDEALATCETTSGEDDDFPGLARACYLLDALLAYNTDASRQPWISELGERVFARSCLLLPAGARVADEEVKRVAEGVRQLHQVAVRRRQKGKSDGLLAERLGAVAGEDADAHPSIAGLACAVLYLDGQMDDRGLAEALGPRLSRGEEPLAAARFVEGLFSLNRSVLVRNRAIVGSLTDFLCRMDGEAFRAVLPVLRRSLAGLSPGEMGYLVATIAAALGVTPEAAEKTAASKQQLDDLAALDSEIGDIFG